ncbi:hypothetical protein V7062_19625, partial [Bacillus pseudomycoides]
MSVNKQQKRLIFLLTVVLVAVFLCVSCQNKKTSSKKSHDDVADVHENKDSEQPSKSDSSKVDVKNNISNQSQNENPPNSENESNIPKQSIETDHTSDSPQNEDDSDSDEEVFSTEVQKESTFVKLEQTDNNRDLNNMNNLIQPAEVSEAQEKEKQDEANKLEAEKREAE